VHDVAPGTAHDLAIGYLERHQVEFEGEIVEGGDEKDATRQKARDGGAVQPELRNGPDAENEDRVEHHVENRAADHQHARQARVARRAHRRRRHHAEHDERHGTVNDRHEPADDRQHVFGSAERAEQRVDRRDADNHAGTRDDKAQQQAVRRQAPGPLVILFTEGPRND